MCASVHVHKYVTIESSRSVKQKYTSRGKPAEFIIGHITALASETAIHGLRAVWSNAPSEGRDGVHIFLGV